MKAFPSPIYEHPKAGKGFNEGMVLRDYFAAKAMHSFLSTKVCKSESDVSAICLDSYTLADAMMEARKK